MPELKVDAQTRPTSPTLRSGDAIAVVRWQPPEWLRAANAELARLGTLSVEERRQEWDALSPQEQAKYNEAYDQVLRNLEERHRGSRGLN